MKYQFDKYIESQAIQEFKNIIDEILSLSNKNYSIEYFIKNSIYKIEKYARANNNYFFILKTYLNDIVENDKYISQKFSIENLIDLYPDINFERIQKQLIENNDIIVCDLNGILITDVKKIELTKYFVCIPIISDQTIFGGLILNYETSYEEVFYLFDYISILLNTFSTCLEKKLIYQQYTGSQKQFSRMVNNALNGIYQSTEDGHIIYANPAFLQIVGYDSLGTLKKIDLSKDLYVSAEQRTEFIQKIKKEKKVYNYKSILRNRDGKEIHVIENSRLIEQPDGTIIFEGIIEDITKQVNLKNKLKFQTGIFEKIIEHAPFLIIGFNKNKEILIWNRIAEKVTGFSYNDIQNDSVTNGLFSRNKFEEIILETEKSNNNYDDGIYYNDIEITTKFNEKKIIRWTNMKLDSLDEEGELVLAFGIEITEIKKLENQLFESQKMESLGTLAAGIAFDFNKMLGELNIYNSSLKSLLKKGSEELDYVNKLEDSINRASAFASKLIGLSRPDKSKSIKFDLNHHINYVIEVLEHTLDKYIKIEKDLTNDILIDGDPSQIQQAILNVALNAREAIENEGKIIFKSEIVLAKSDNHLQAHENTMRNYVKITIADTGKGIPKELQKRVFDPFYTTKSIAKATGLGLSVVYNIVKNHNGFVFVESSPGKGTEFLIYFPYEGEVANKIELTSDKSDEKAKQKATILVVDDEYIIRDLLNDVLNDLNLNVILAKDGIEGLELYKTHNNNIDITILDIIMPGMTGKEVFEKIREINPQAKIIISSGYSQQKITNMLIANGANGFLPKPFNIDKLVGLIGALVKEN